MKLFKGLIIGVLVCFAAISCNKDNAKRNKVAITGTVLKQNITTYQYGSHIMAGYALRSSAVNLDDYVNQTVTALGYKIDGYPVDGGPDFIEVEEIK